MVLAVLEDTLVLSLSKGKATVCAKLTTSAAACSMVRYCSVSESKPS